MRRFRRRAGRRLLIIGLDCLGAGLLFQELAADLPNIRALMRQGTWGQLDSTVPCITIPAWSSMLTGRDPGVLGLYGFRSRARYDYASLELADSRSLQHPRIWDYVGAARRESLVVNVPQTYPPAPLRGRLVSGFLTPHASADFAFPAILKNQILTRCPSYRFDVRDYRRVKREALLQQIIDGTVEQYRLFEELLTEQRWDFAIHVNIFSDRLHHTFWRYHDPAHRLHQPAHRLRFAIRDYYRLVDEKIGRILGRLAGDELVMVVSDHGVKRMDGAVCINQWLWQNGWLAFKRAAAPTAVTAFDADAVDWQRTRAWSGGGYCGRIYLNVQGREPQGSIPRAAVDAVRQELAEQLRGLVDADGSPIKAEVYAPQSLYQQVNRIAPDLLVYFGDLHWRTVGGVGYETVTVRENDLGPDDANHAMEGVYILYDPKRSGAGESAACQVMDVASTALHALCLTVPPDLQGRVMPGLR